MGRRPRSQHWRISADISGSVRSNASAVTKAEGIVRRLQGMNVFQSVEHRTVLTELVEAAEAGGIPLFEEKLDVLYNFCDYNRIWLGP